MGHTISREQALNAARAFVDATADGFRYEPCEATYERGRWTVIFTVISPEGATLDGPAVVLVDGAGKVLPGPSGL